MKQKERLSVFRILRNQCQGCNQQYLQVAYVRVNGWKKLCPDCTVRAFSSFVTPEPIILDPQYCERCDRPCFFFYQTLWYERNQIWCAECVQEVLIIQIPKGKCSL